MDCQTTLGEENTTAELAPPSPNDLVTIGHEELDDFVLRSRSEAVEYLKMLREEITKTDASRTRYTFLTWLLVAILALMDVSAVNLKIDLFEQIDQVLVYKLLPAAILCSSYLMVARMFVQRERLVIFFEISRRLFSCKSFPLNYYIKPTHFMLSERLLNLSRPKKEMLGNVLMLGIIVTVTVYGPIVFALYGYYSIFNKFGPRDLYVLISFAVGAVALIQAVVSLRGSRVMNKQDGGKTAPRAHEFRG